MVDTQYLVDVMNNSGLKREFVAKKIGCTRQSFSKKLKTGNFDIKEADTLSEIFGFNSRERNRIFFAKNVTNNSDE